MSFGILRQIIKAKSARAERLFFLKFFGNFTLSFGILLQIIKPTSARAARLFFLKFGNFTLSFGILRQIIKPKFACAARVARLFFLIQPIRSLFPGVVVAVDVVLA